MLHIKILPKSILILTILLSYVTAQQSCSSVQILVDIANNNLQELAKECSIKPLKDFTLDLPLSLPTRPSHLTIRLNNSYDNVFLNLQLDPRGNNYNIEFANQEKYEKYTIPASTRTLKLVINKGTYTISFDHSLITISGKLESISPYAFSVQLDPHLDLHNNSLKSTKSTSFRVLTQCSEDYFLVGDTCMKVCPAKQYESNGVCTKCPDNCRTGHCISGNLCNPCPAGEIYSKELTKCVEKCPEGFFEDYNNKICVKCADGCTTCSFPNGLCSSSYFKTDMIINLIVSMSLLSLITLCACCCNKEKNDPTKNKEQDEKEQQKQSTQDSQSKNQENPETIKKVPGGNQQDAYLILPEDINNYDEEGSDRMPERKKRLMQFAESKLLTLSVQKKEFMIDDADEEKAISHGSASRLNHKIGSLSSLTSTPLRKRRDSKNTSNGAIGSSVHIKRKSYGEIGSPYSAGSGLIAKKQTSLGLIGKKSADATLPLDVTEEDREDSRPTVELSQLEKGPKTVEEVEEIEEEEMGKREGYSGDSSFSMSKEKEGYGDLHTCTICGMNKRDCLNKPCGHIVGCYACMEQFKESYGVCPRCKNALKKIAKIL